MIRADNLHHAFSKPVLEGVSFDVRAGEVVGYLGPNGGSTTQAGGLPVPPATKPTRGLT